MHGAKPRFESITPRIPVRSVEEALGFYRDQLGFDVEWQWGAPITHASVCRDSINLDLMAAPETRSGTAMAYIEVSGVDAYYAELNARGVSLGELGNRDYGMRDFEVVDPHGNRLAFGEPTEG